MENKHLPRTRSNTNRPPEHMIKIWQFIFDYRQKYDISPAMQDYIDAGLATSTSVVGYYLNHMLESNMIRRSPVANRRAIIPLEKENWTDWKNKVKPKKPNDSESDEKE